MPADILITNADVLTMIGDTPRAEAIAVEANKIVYVGSNNDVRQFGGPNTRVIDAHGATVLPGFVEAHLHIFSGSTL